MCKQVVEIGTKYLIIFEAEDREEREDLKVLG